MNAFPYPGRPDRFVLFVVLLFSISVFAQEEGRLKKLTDATNAFYGPNDLLNIGEVYRPENRSAKGDPYFLRNDYTPASVMVKGNVFHHVGAKYNIATDQLIVLTQVDTGSYVEIAGKENWIDSFRISQHHFVNIALFEAGKHLRGYYELVYKGKRNLFIKHTKELIAAYKDSNPFKYYSEARTQLFISDGNRLIPLKNKRSFLNIYGENKTAIKKYLRKNKIQLSKASNLQLYQLMQFSDGLPQAL